MINFNALKTNIALLITDLTSQVVIWGDQNSSTPTGDFIRIKIDNFSKIGFEDWTGHPDDTGIAPTQGDREIILSIQSISINSMQILAELVGDLELQETLGSLREKKLVYVNQEGDITDITTKIGDRFESRAVLNLRFRISRNYTVDNGDNTNYVKTVEIKSKVDNFEDEYNIES
jgi:hypothetical protein